MKTSTQTGAGAGPGIAALLVLGMLGAALRCGGTSEQPAIAAMSTGSPVTTASPPIASTASSTQSAPSDRQAADGGAPDTIQAKELLLPNLIRFRTNSDEILPESDDIVKLVVSYLRDNPRITLLRIESNIDNMGARRRSEELAAKRAMAVARRLIKEGIDCRRLLPVTVDVAGVVGNITPTGRTKRRRVTFVPAGVDNAPIKGATFPVLLWSGDPCGDPPLGPAQGGQIFRSPYACFPA